jgi:dTDP-4-amino-4,6-dideoxygalactose transaminase
MVLTNNTEYYEKLKLFHAHGITKDPKKLIKNEGPWYYEMQYLGYNYRLTDFQCALGINQLKKLDKFIDRRRKIVQKYNNSFKELTGLLLPCEKSNVRSAYHLYIIQLQLEKLSVHRKKSLMRYERKISESDSLHPDSSSPIINKTMDTDERIFPTLSNIITRRLPSLFRSCLMM